MELINLKSGWRNITKNKLFSAINILGLSIGFAVSTLIFFWIVDELNFDKFHTNLNNMYTIYEHQQYSDGQELFTWCTPFPLSSKLKNDYDEVLNATTFASMGEFPIRYTDKEYIEGPCVAVDSQFLNIFSFHIIEGDPNALYSPNKIMITPEIASMFFNGESAIGKTLTINGDNSFEVGAIIEKPGKNSSINFKVLYPIYFMFNNGMANPSSWGNNWPRTVVQFTNGTNAKDFEAKIINICKDNGQESTSLHTFPFKNEHLYSYSGKNNRVQNIYQFLAIALIIILIACINFVNFSTARSEQRRPEVGIRKTMGATKMNITRQFLTEKGLMVLISLVISVILVALLMPLFNRLADKTITLALFQNKYLLAMLSGVVLITILLSVTYPSLYVSSFTPARVMKKQSKNGTGFFNFRSILVVVQFALSIGLIICSLSISKQLKYINNYNIGYNKDNLIYIDLPGLTKQKHELIATELSKINGVVSLSKVNKTPFYGGNSSWGYDWEGKDPEKKVLICSMEVDPDYFKTMGMQFNGGKEFSERYNHIDADKPIPINEVILNEEAIRRMGMDDAVGKYFGRNGQSKSTIVGVVKNFNFEPLRVEIEPMVISPLQYNPNNIILRIRPDNFYATVNQVKDTWSKLFPQTPCELGFFDEQLRNMYYSEIKISGLFRSFSLVAIFIACIGLFGLSLYAIELRRKEIGIRKVNGSTSFEILKLINKDFVSLVIVSFIIACPVAYYAMTKWLQNFAYKSQLGWWVFVLSGFLALTIALITVSWQSLRAARRNPVEALRYE